MAIADKRPERANVIDARPLLCYSWGNAEDSYDPVYSRAGTVGNASPTACGIVHFLKVAQPRGVQEQVLREHDLLRGLREEQRSCFTPALPGRRFQTGNRVCLRSRRQHASSGARAGIHWRNGATPRAFAASSGGELHLSHLIQRR
jgi:hypothetical protein